jgi:hypothetical protein
MDSKLPILQPPTDTTSKIYSVEYYPESVDIWLTFPLSPEQLYDELQSTTYGGLEYFDNNHKPPGYDNGDIFHLPFHNRFIAMVRLFLPSDATFEGLQEYGREAMRSRDRRHSIVQSQFKVTSGILLHEIFGRSDDDAAAVAEYITSVHYGTDDPNKPQITYQAVTSEVYNEAAAQGRLVCNSAYCMRGIGIHGLDDLIKLDYRQLWQSQLRLQERIGKKVIANIDPTEFLREYPQSASSLSFYRSIGYAIPI